MSAPHNDDSRSLADVLQVRLSERLSSSGFEVSPFLTGWYNSFVVPRLKLDNEIAPYDDCLAFCIISTPKMFERSFLPHVQMWSQYPEFDSLENYLKSLRSQVSGCRITPTSKDPFDWSVFLTLNNTLQNVIEEFKAASKLEQLDCLSSAEWIPDFAMRPVTRIPYVHVQSAGHVSGMAYYHQKDNQVKEKGQRVYYGCSLHPRYGGWFGFRGIYVFPNLRQAQLTRKEAVSPISPGHPPFHPEVINDLLHEYNENGNENNWRSFGLEKVIHEQYTIKAEAYFSTTPSKRTNLLETWLHQSTGDISSLIAVT